MPIDTHCHLADPAFADDLTGVVERARAAGVDRALCILAADDAAEAVQAAAVRDAWPAVRFAAGIHPHRAGAWQGRLDQVRPLIDAAVALHEAVAIGEIGLDYHYDLAPPAIQRDLFALQVDLAVAADRPVVIHARESIDDTVAILAAGGSGVRGVMHCFTGTVAEVRKALDLGFYISLSGILTFPRSAVLREVATFVPLDRLLVETDAPYLAPVPFRGRRNEPAWVTETTRVLAGLRSMSVESLSARLAGNSAAFVPALGASDAR